MITWLTAVLVYATYAVCKAVGGHVCTETHEHLAAMATVVLVAVPAIYAVGWLFLPAWGVGVVR